LLIKFVIFSRPVNLSIGFLVYFSLLILIQAKIRLLAAQSLAQETQDFYVKAVRQNRMGF